METEKKKGRIKWIILLVAVIAVAAAGRFLLTRRSADTEEKTQAETETVSRGTISKTAEGSGSVEAASTKAIALEYDGKIDEIFVETGDQVKTGDVLAKYDTDALDTVIDQKESEIDAVNEKIASTDDSGSTTITAPVSGRVKRIYAAEGDVAANVVSVYGGVAEIAADNKLKVEFESSSANLSEGDKVTVEVDSDSVTGTVVKAEDGNYCVTIEDQEDYDLGDTAEIRDRSGKQIGSGSIESNHPYLVDAAYGTIDEVRVSKNDYVSAGDTLFTREDVKYNKTYLDLLSDREELIQDLMDLKEYQKNPVVTSENDGYLVSIDVIEGMTYEKDQQFGTVADEETLQLKVEIDELDIDGVEIGQSAEVVFDAFEEETYEGTVTKISGVGNNSGGVTTYTVTIELSGDTRLKNAMSATATILMEKKENVLLVPVDAIESVNGQRCVNVVNGSETVQRAITVGITQDDYAEVIDGLEEGEQVVLNRVDSVDLFSQMMTQRENMMDSMQN